MICNCGGMLFVINIHEEEKNESRLCDVQCGNCEKTLYYQPYDPGQRLNVIKGGKET